MYQTYWPCTPDELIVISVYTSVLASTARQSLSQSGWICSLTIIKCSNKTFCILIFNRFFVTMEQILKITAVSIKCVYYYVCNVIQLSIHYYQIYILILPTDRHTTKLWTSLQLILQYYVIHILFYFKKFKFGRKFYSQTKLKFALRKRYAVF